MDVRASIFRMTVSGNTCDGVNSAQGQYLDFAALGYSDEPVSFNTGNGCFYFDNGADPVCLDQFNLESGKTGELPPDYDCPSNYWGSEYSPERYTALSHRAFSHLAPHADTGYTDCFVSVFANASDPDSIQRVVRFHSPVEYTGTGEGPQDAKPVIGGDSAHLDESGINWFNAHGVYPIYGWYFLDGQPRTIGGHASHLQGAYNSYQSCFLDYNFQEYQYPINYGEVHPTAMGDPCENSSISGWVNPCQDINLMISINGDERESLKYEPIKIKFKNNSDLPTFFSVSAGKDKAMPGKGFGVVAPDALGATGSKGEYDFDYGYFEEFTDYGRVTFTSNYPHESGFVAPGGTSTEYLIDSSFDYFVVEVLRGNSTMTSSTNWEPGLMVQDAWIVAVGEVSTLVEDWWKDGHPVSGHLSRPAGHGVGGAGNSSNSATLFPFGKLVSMQQGSMTQYDGHTVKWHDTISVPSSIAANNILVAYAEPKTKIDTLTASVQSAVIPSAGSGALGLQDIAAPINPDINFGPYDADHLLFDLVEGVACMERAEYDLTLQTWGYCYTYMNPFHDSPNMYTPSFADMYGGFVFPSFSLGASSQIDNWVTRGGISQQIQYEEAFTSGFNQCAPSWSNATGVLWPQNQDTCYSSISRNLAPGIASVHNIRDAMPISPGGYNTNEDGPYLRESLFEMRLLSGTFPAGYIEGRQTEDLGAVYDPTWPTSASDPLVQYHNIFISEPISIDVYKVEKTLTVTSY
jgi:hypothetical protein